MRRAPRSADDGHRTPLAPGLRSSADGERLAEEIAFAAARLTRLSTNPPGLYGEVAREGDDEEALWLAFLIAYLSPLEDEHPFAGVEGARTAWNSGELPALEDVSTGPRTAHDPARGDATLLAHRAWAQRAGSQLAALTGEPHWNAERRFARAFEGLSLPGLHRAARFDFLATVGASGRVELEAGSLFLRDDATTLGAKRVFGIADPLLLDRRATALAQACDVPLAALDLALFNWQQESGRVALGVTAPSEPDVRDRALAALGVPQSDR